MKKISLIIMVAAFTGAQARAAGFEKSVMWSGKHAGYAGAAVSSVTGGQSLFFNPAGLAGPGDISINYSPTFINVDGYLASADRKVESSEGPISFGGLTASYSKGKFGFGVGAYVVGGEKANYENVDLTGNAPAVGYRPTLTTDLEITEYSIGAAIELAPGLRVGANWRINKASGELSTIKKTTTDTAFIFLHIKDIEQTNYGGWRIGMQYEPPEKGWGLGLSYRSSITYDAAGVGTGNTIVAANGAVVPQTMSNIVKVGLLFPEAYNFGLHYLAGRDLKLMTGLDYVRYSKNENIILTGTANGTALPNIPLMWLDMWNFRLGFEYTGYDKIAIRAGYALTTKVTSGIHAKATLPPAGSGHLLVAGLGYSLSEALDLDAAFEYSLNNGSGSMTQPTSTTKELLAGVTTETKARVYALHTGLTYRF